MNRWRRPAGVALVVATALMLAAAALSGYARSALVDDRELSARAALALEDPDVRTVVGERVVDGLERSVLPDLLVVRPLVVPAVAALAGTRGFRLVFTEAVAARHRALIDGESTFSFELPVGEVLHDPLRSVSPRLARAVPPDLRVLILRLDPRDVELAAARRLRGLAGWWWPLLGAALLAAVATALLAGGVRVALVNLGVAVAGAGLLVAAAVAGLGAWVVAHAAQAAGLADETERGTVGAVWAALFSDLLAAGLIAALGGVLVAALTAGTGVHRALAPTWTRSLGLLRSRLPAARLGRAAGLVALGVLLVVEPRFAGRLLLVVGGGLLVLAGVAQLAGDAPEAGPARGSAWTPPLLVAGAMAAAVAATVVAVALVLPGPRATPIATAVAGVGCNGAAALCDRRLDEAVFAATHNSYAAADEPGWLFANQRFGIARQLRDGIRGFLIDVHYGVADPASGRVRTDLEAEGSSRNKVARELSPAALRAADRLAGRVGREMPVGDRRPYLCHTLCELGSEPLEEELDVIRAFLDENRREVILLIVEPYVPVEEIERALDAAGLLGQAAELRRDEPLPTLGELMRAGTRLVVMAEEDGGARPWYLPAFSFVQDTPLGATTPAELRCRRFRGSADSPLYMLNHWIPPYPPSVSRNARIGGRALERRLNRCERSRGLLPNLVAVDFYERSGVVDIARRRNAR